MSQILALFRDEEVWTIDTHWMGCDAAKIRLCLDSGGNGMYADDPRVMIIEEFQQWVSLSRKKAKTSNLHQVWVTSYTLSIIRQSYVVLIDA